MTMLPFSALSRRALVVAATALVAVVPSAEARTRKPPLAFVKATLSDPTVPDVSTFGFTFQAAIAHPASDTRDETTGSVFVDSDTSATEARAVITSALKDVGSLALANLGQTVPADRIAVVLL
jgi:hypothetical protein